MKRSKRYIAVKERIDRERLYSVAAGVKLLKECATAKFNEAADVVFSLGVDPKKNEHRIRGTVTLPHGTGKSVKVLAFAKGDKLKEAQEAGADYVGGEDLVKKIEAGWLDFDRVVATPDIMSVVSRLGKVLGPRGLMPSPKGGTVTPDIGLAVKEFKRGKLEFRLDEYGNIHTLFGRCSFTAEQLQENLLALTASILEEKPADVKGRYIEAVTIASTMGPGIKIDSAELQKLVAAGRL